VVVGAAGLVVGVVVPVAGAGALGDGAGLDCDDPELAVTTGAAGALLSVVGCADGVPISAGTIDAVSAMKDSGSSPSTRNRVRAAATSGSEPGSFTGPVVRGAKAGLPTIALV
jgi:hypothetical protein